MAAVLVCALVVLGAGAPSRVAANPLLPRARTLLRTFQEEAALRVLERARRWPQNTPQELAEAYLLTGLAQAALAREKEAVDAFRQARLLAPGLSLPKSAAPRVEAWWREAAPDAEANLAAPSPAASSPPVPLESTGSVSPVSPVAATAPTEAVPSTAPQSVALSPEATTATSVAAPVAPIDARAEATPVAALERPHNLPRWLGVAGLVAGAAVAAGGVTQGLSAQAHQARSATLASVGEAQAEHQVGVAAAVRANWLYGLGAALGVAGGVCLAVSF